MTTETIVEFAGYVKIISPRANIDGLYAPDMAHRLANALAELGKENLGEDIGGWITDTVLRIARCAEQAEAVRNELRERGYSVPSRVSAPASAPAMWRSDALHLQI